MPDDRLVEDLQSGRHVVAEQRGILKITRCWIQLGLRHPKHDSEDPQRLRLEYSLLGESTDHCRAEELQVVLCQRYQVSFMQVSQRLGRIEDQIERAAEAGAVADQLFLDRIYRVETVDDLAGIPEYLTACLAGASASIPAL